jgi:hypothetical protein
MNKKPMFGIISLVLIGLVAAFSFAMPFVNFEKESANMTGQDMKWRADKMIGKGIIMPFGNFRGERLDSNDSVRNAIENNDYDAYMAAIEAEFDEFKEQMTKDKFEEIVNFQKNMTLNKESMQKSMENIKDAIESDDYEAWAAAVNNTPERRLLDVITKDNFSTYLDMHKALESGNFSQAKELSDSLGLQTPNQGPQHFENENDRGMGRFKR